MMLLRTESDIFFKASCVQEERAGIDVLLDWTALCPNKGLGNKFANQKVNLHRECLVPLV